MKGLYVPVSAVGLFHSLFTPLSSLQVDCIAFRIPPGVKHPGPTLDNMEVVEG